MTCSSCRAEIAPGLKFCPHCGAPAAGRSLRVWIDECASRGREIPLATAIGLLSGILDALAILHETGLVHSELCPENVLVGGHPLRGELDVSLLISTDTPLPDPAAHLPGNEDMLGAPAWAAPEGRTSPGGVGPSADLFAAGAILYELLLQVPPEGRWELPSVIRGDIPPEIDAFLMRAMNPRPARRFPDTGRMAEAARKALAAAPGRFGYSPRERERFERLMVEPAWRRARGGRNCRGLLVALHEATGLEFTLIPGGEIEVEGQGAAGARPILRAHVDPFLLCSTPCTQEAWDRIGLPDRRRFRGPELPMEGVSHVDARGWCERAGGGLRLPSEIEWGYAGRAGTRTAFCFGDDEGGLGEYGWSREVSGGRTHPVRGKRPNAWGLFDVHGNVWEWCEDAETGDESAETGKPGRGGSWRVSAHDCRMDRRKRADPTARGGALGFRPAASLP